jgi:hypothetical protein
MILWEYRPRQARTLINDLAAHQRSTGFRALTLELYRKKINNAQYSQSEREISIIFPHDNLCCSFECPGFAELSKCQIQKAEQGTATRE